VPHYDEVREFAENGLAIAIANDKYVYSSEKGEIIRPKN